MVLVLILILVLVLVLVMVLLLLAVPELLLHVQTVVMVRAAAVLPALTYLEGSCTSHNDTNHFVVGQCMRGSGSR
jgi:hypothetical protein